MVRLQSVYKDERRNYSREGGLRQFNYANIYLYNGYNHGMRLTTRVRILDYLRKQQTASAHELGLAMNLTAADIRHHLAALEATDLVEVIGQRRGGQRGRPVNLYSLSHRALGDGLEALSSALLTEWLEQGPESSRRLALRSLAQRLNSANPARPTLPLIQRLTSTVDHLNQLHYQSRWEATASGPRLILGHCPYVAIIDAHPELCWMDAYLLEEGLQCSLQQTAKLQPTSRGLRVCVFQARSK
jgi:predicted ArsR family transcriptional regulator